MAKRFYTDDSSPSNEEPSCCVSVVRYVMILLNMIFLLAFIAAVVAASLAETGNFDEFKRNCSICSDWWIVIIVLFACLGAVSMIGLVALCCRIRWVVYVYFTITVIQGLALLTAGSMLVVIHEGALDDALKSDWDGSSVDHQCSSQITAQCSGWTEICGNVTSRMILNETIPEGCANCGWERNNEIASFSQTCEHKLNHDIDQVFVPASVVTFVAGALCFVAGFVACRVRKTKANGEDATLLNEQYV